MQHVKQLTENSIKMHLINLLFLRTKSNAENEAFLSFCILMIPSEREKYKFYTSWHFLFTLFFGGYLIKCVNDKRLYEKNP
jgi:hypothetical protein